MQLLDVSLAATAEHLALEEAVLLAAEQGLGPSELLHLWEPKELVVVVGRGSRVAQEVNLEYCCQANISVYRRCSGGAAVVGGPGCLMYGVILDRRRHVELAQIDSVHCYVLQKMAASLSRLGTKVQIAGTSDLVIDSSPRVDDDSQMLKFSGNSLRIRKDQVLYHGTILYDFPPPVIANCLKSPPRQPNYRNQRDHASFVSNFPATIACLRETILQGWDIGQTVSDFPRDAVEKLVSEKYGTAAWNFRH